MSNPEHLGKLLEGVEAWNKWRMQNPEIEPDLKEADLREANLWKAHLRDTNFRGANLSEANLREADLREAHLSKAHLWKAHLRDANVRGANLSEAYLREADLREAHLGKADLRGANLSGTNLSDADLRGANLIEAYLGKANLHGANLSGTNLSGANLSGASLVDINLEGANLTGCRVYGVSVWNASLEGATQSNLIITRDNESVIQVDNLQVAQFVYSLLNNKEIRNVIDTITSKVVLILGRFTAERKKVLDAIREELRRRDYVPVLFDFEKPASKDLTGTVSTLANMARFIIADLTDSASVPHELATLAPSTVVPVQTVLLEGQREYAMFPDLVKRYHWVLEPYQYKSPELLIDQLKARVIGPAEAKAIELRSK